VNKGKAVLWDETLSRLADVCRHCVYPDAGNCYLWNVDAYLPYYTASRLRWQLSSNA